MSNKGPIIILEDDPDDQELLTEALQESDTENKLIFFTNGQDAYDYLMETTDQPFLILSDVNLPVMNGLDFRKMINENDYLRQKSIPFIYFSTSAEEASVNKAYLMNVQGFFVKQSRFEDLKNSMRIIMDYWKLCKHPNNS